MANKPKLRYKLNKDKCSVSLARWSYPQFHRGYKLFIKYATVKVLWRKALTKHQRNMFLKCSVYIDSDLAAVLPAKTTIQVRVSEECKITLDNFEVYACIARKHVTNELLAYFLKA